MRVVFMGTPEFGVSVLRRLVEDRWNVVAAYTQPDKPKRQHNPAVRNILLFIFNSPKSYFIFFLSYSLKIK